MIEQILRRLENENLVDWGVILQGWMAIPGCNHRIEASYVKDFVSSKMEKEKGDISSILIELFSVDSLEREEVASLLQDMCEQEKIDKKVSLEKWRLAMLEEIIENFSNDCIYDLIKLTDFWRLWGNPKDKPHVIQGLDNKMNPTEYYSKENYKKLLEAHQNWIKREKHKIGNY